MNNLISLIIIFQLAFAIWPVRILSENNNNCGKSFQFKPNRIILTQKSISAGAKFLKKLRVSSFKECYFMCCNTNECSTAIFDSKVKQACFMFDCRPPGQCFYSSHSNYDIIYLEEMSVNQSLRNMVGLNKHCDSNNLCDGAKTICSDGVCICQSGWIAKKGSCVQSVCKSPELQFQCDDSSACVAIYDKCNGIVECPDGSDELSCPSKINRRNETKSSSSLSHDHKQSELDDISLSKLQSTENHQPLERFYSNQQSLSGSSSSSSSTTQGTTSSAFIDLHDLPTEPMIFSSQQKSHNDREPILGSHSIKLDHQKQLFDIDDRETPSFLFDIHGKNNENNNNNDNPEVLFSSNDNPWRYPKDFLHETSRSDGPTHLLSRQQIYPPESRPLTPEIMKSYDETVYKPRLYRMPNEIDYSPHSRRNGLAFIPYHHYDHFMQKSNPDDSPIFHRYNSFSRKQRPEVILDPSVIEDMEFYNKLGETSESSKKYPLFHEPKRIHHGSEYEYTHQESNIPKNRQQPSTMANLHITTTDSSQSIIAAVKQSQSEGHTSALLLAFSLGLICCFIGLLIAEWRRRQKLHLWSKSSYRSRPEQAIVFGGRTKISMSRLKPYRRIKKGSGIHGQISKNSTTIHPNTENADEEKALFDDLVL